MKHWHGRLRQVGLTGGVIRVAGEDRSFALARACDGVRAGDIVSLAGQEEGQTLRVTVVHVMAPALRPPTQEPSEVLGRLRLRGAVLSAVRRFFDARGYLEVETPALVEAPGQEANLDPFCTDLHLPAQGESGRYLITSPEHHMKRLLGLGSERIYQVCRCFRDGERSTQHRPEFVMVEWYRAWVTFREIAAEVAGLVAHVAREVLGTERLRWQGAPLNLTPPWAHLSVRGAFRDLAGIDLESADDGPALVAAARSAGCLSVGEHDSWEDAFHKVLLDRVEPALATRGAVVLEDYPAQLAALAKLQEGRRSVAERFEAYLGGMELANGFTELNDPREQRRRFMAQRQERRQRGADVIPLDEAFLAAMEGGIPPAGGVALGLDRLAMVLADAASIDETQAFPGE